ncbi:hypothetical protein [Avibacterium volantium]|uniref:hypothetical protein n=1 Tax=Avibacterium volantium TaxID=762 RepID=UPI0013E02100
MQRFKKYGINGLVRQPNRKKNTMKTPKLPIKTDEKSLLLQELEYLRAENAYLKKPLELRRLKLKRKNVPPSEN